MRRSFAVAAALVAALLTPTRSAPAQEPSSRSPFAAFATGTPIHAEVLRAGTGGPTLVSAGVAVSAASVASDGLPGSVTDELGQPVQPAAPAGAKSYGRGVGLEAVVGGGTPVGTGVALPGGVESTAPPSPPVRSSELGPVRIDPIAYASLVRAEARPAWSERSCVIGRPNAFGLASAGEAQLLDVGALGARAFTRPLVAAAAGNPTDRAVSESRSFTYLDPNPDGTFALVSETRQTIAPVTLFRGTGAEVTIEVLGEWILRATARGKPDGATVDFAPAGAGPNTPALRLVHGGVVTELTLQQLLGAGGLHLAAGPLVDVSVGERPRAIAARARDADPARPPDRSADGTRAAGAVDVVRVSLLQPAPPGGPRAVELRLGHMEASATVPAGGIGCRIPVRKAGAPTFVNPGDAFRWTISIPSAADDFDGLSCDLVSLSALDRARATPGVRFTILSASDGGVIDGDTVRWPDLGRYRPGSKPIVLTVIGRVAADSARGVLRDTVDVGASLDSCRAGVATPAASGTDAVVMRGAFTLEGPTVRRYVEADSRIEGSPSGDSRSDGGNPGSPRGGGDRPLTGLYPGKEHVTVATTRLRLVHGEVCVVQKLFERSPFLADGDPDAGRQNEFAAVGEEHGSAKGFDDSERKVYCVAR